MSYSQTTTTSDPRRRLDGVLDQLTQRIPGMAHAIAVSGDGIRLGATSRLGEEQADHLAAVVSGLVSLGTGATRTLHTDAVIYSMIVMTGGVLIVQAVADGTSLAALAAPDADTAMVAFELAALAKRIGAAIAPTPRASELGG